MYAKWICLRELVLLEFSGPDFDKTFAEELEKLNQELAKSQAEEAAKIANRPRPEVVNALVKRAKAEIESASPASPPKPSALNSPASVAENSDDTMEVQIYLPFDVPALFQATSDLPQTRVPDDQLRAEMSAEWMDIWDAELNPVRMHPFRLLKAIDSGRAFILRHQIPANGGKFMSDRDAERLAYVATVTTKLEEAYEQRTGNAPWKHAAPHRPLTPAEKRASTGKAGQGKAAKKRVHPVAGYSPAEYAEKFGRTGPSLRRSEGGSRGAAKVKAAAQGKGGS